MDGKNAIVTGGNRGIGESISLGLAAMGCNVAVVARDEEASLNVIRKIHNIYKRKSIFIKVDLTKKNDIEEMVNKFYSRFDKIDILISNAGIINRPRRPAVEIEENTWDMVLDTNLKGAFFICQEVGKKMIYQKELHYEQEKISRYRCGRKRYRFRRSNHSSPHSSSRYSSA